MASKLPDENDKALAGTLPKDPAADAEVMIPGPRVLTVKQLLEDSANRAMAPAGNRRQCTTGNYRLDQACGGIRPGSVWVFGAETSWGKSSWLVMLADLNLRAGKRVLIVTSEDDQSVYGDRLMARRARVKASHIRDNNLDPEETKRVVDTAMRGEPLPVFLDAIGADAEVTVEHMRELITTHKIDLVLVDYLQEFRSGSRQQDRRNEVSAVASMLRSTIKRGGAAGVIFSQITVSEGKKRPDKHSIRESRDVPNGAEAVLLGCNVTDGHGRITARTLLIDKMKGGAKGYTLELEWNSELACFESQQDPATEASANAHASMNGMFEESTHRADIHDRD